MVTVAITDKIYLKNHQQIVSQMETSFPKGAFNGATMDILYQGSGLAELDDATRDRIMDFAEDFLDCDCEANPHCGCPERKFTRYLLGLREQGLGPDAVVDVMGDDYMLYAYPGDVLSFLDSSVRTLEAAETLADVDGQTEAGEQIRAVRENLVR
jgi:superfamily II helicase